MHLVKMQGFGNYYLYRSIQYSSKLSIKLSDRHFGTGSDGLILIEPSRIAGL